MGSGRNIEEASRRSSRRLHTSRTLPSLPTHPGLQGVSGLRGALEFLEWPASEWTPKDLQDWFVDHLVTPGLMKRPQIVREPGATPVMLDPRADGGSNLEELIHKARGRVITALRGLIAPVADDRFLNAAIYGGRVRRAAVGGRPVWVASPREIDFLGDIVLSLLAADILLDREFYRAHLCICEVCGRVSFKETADARGVCSEHRSSVSGFTPRVR
ncbi:hypothetical protein WME73_28100 [Sorangium sp. So ce302]|uniref:hypothetical protein n=1 Tax=unclassified Sorangium TaxID=2621164 RepID=UPI003F62A129